MVETLEQALSPERPVEGKQKRYWSMSDIVNADVANYNRIARADQILDRTASNLGVFDRVVEGTASGIAEMITKTPEQVKIFYGQTQMNIGLKTGDVEKISVGKALVQTATRNLDMINEEMERKSSATVRDRESFAYGTGNALASYGSMWFTAGVLGKAARIVGASSKTAQAVGTAGGVANMAVQEMGGEVEEGIQVYRGKKPEDQNLENVSPEWASKEVMTTMAYGTVSSIIEKKMGFGLQRKVFLKPMDIVKRGLVGGTSEYTTENLQSLANMGIDLADGSMDWEKLPPRLKDEFVGNLPAFLLGAGGGVVMGVDQRAQTKNAIRDMVKNSVPPTDLEIVVDNVYDSAIENLSGIVAKELEISSELRAKHGAIYDSMVKAVANAVDNSKSQNFGDEAEKAQYISDVSKRFADEVLAEANLRGTPIDEVLEATNIVFEDGGIKFKQDINLLDYVTGIRSIPKDFNLPRTDLLSFLKSKGGIKDIGGDIRSMGAIKQYPGLINNKRGKSLDDLALSAWEAGYFPDQMERPDLDYMREMIDRALRGKKIFNREQKGTIREEIDGLLEQLDRMGIDYRNKTTAQLEEEIAGIDELKSLAREYDFYLENELVHDMEQLERPEGYEVEFERDLFQNITLKDILDSLPEGVVVRATENDNIINISKIVVDKDKRGLGIGSDVMNIIIDYADNNKKRIELTPSKDFGATSLERLNRFYKRFEFVDNKGKHKDYSTRNSMYREPKTNNIYNQAEEAFKPNKQETARYNEDLNKALRGELGSKQVLRLGKTPEVYISAGLEQKPLIMPQEILKKINVGKHNVGLDVIENLPNLISDPAMVLNSRTKEGSLVAVLDAFDSSNRVIVAIITPTEGKSNVIPTVYGRSDFVNFLKSNINEGNLRYLNKEKASKLLRVQRLQLPKWEQLRGSDDNISSREDIVNRYNQKAKGSFNTNEKIIRLFENADYSTLSHELGHYWLDNMWEYVRSGNASDTYAERWNTVARWLNIKPEQTRLTRTQQEKFASGYEAYLTRGIFPSPIIKGAFDDYDNWLKRVYKNANSVRYQNGKKQLPIRFTEDALRFFDSMTSGKLDAPVAKAPKKSPIQELNTRLKSLGRSDLSKTVNNTIQANKTSSIETPSISEDLAPIPNIIHTTQVSNIPEGEKGNSSVYSREAKKNADQLGNELANSVEYNKVNLEDQSIKALKFVRENLEAAKRVIDGERVPDGLLDTAVRIAYENEMLRMGNNAEYIRALKLHSAMQTARGQEIAAEKLATNDMLQPKYWLGKVLASREARVVTDLFGGDVKKYQNAIRKETVDAVKDLIGLDLEAQTDYLAGLAENLKEKYNIKDTLFQTPLDEALDENTAPLYVRNFLEETFGISVNEAEAATIINKADQLSKSFENSLDSNGNPSVESFKILAEMNRTVESFAPSPVITVMSSILGRSNMLASVKSPTLNIISNVENFITEAVVRRLSNGNGSMAVDKEAIRNYKLWAWNVYKASGFIPSQMMNIADEVTTLGESRPTSQGKGKIRQISQVMENIVFKYLMGAPDAVAKDYTFVDSADLHATTIAKAEGLSGEALSKRATEIFNDAILIQPQTEAGMEVREKAVGDAHVATYTNDSVISKWALKGREWLNGLGTGKLRAGDLLMPFVKTPANVAMLGLEYGMGGLYTAYKIPEILKNPRSPEAQRAMKAAYRNGLGIILSLLLASLVNPEDYIPEFDNATQKDRDLARAKNAPFNSIKIGNKYVSLDYFGPLAVPLVGILNARREESIKGMISNYIKGTTTQAAKIPGVKEVMAVNDSIQRIAASSTTPEKFIEQLSNDVINQIRARTVPAIVNDIAKMTDAYERDASEGVLSKVKASIPLLRNSLPERFNIEGAPLESENSLNILLFGSRVKTSNEGSIVNEVSRLASKKTQPSISDVTRYGDLRFLSPEEKIAVRQQYAKNFAKSVRKELSGRTYKGKDDESKKRAINKIRTNIVKEIKAKYAKSIERGKKEAE